MKKLSTKAEKLLSEIIEHRDERGNCDTNYWKKRFEDVTVSEDAILRSLFKELREEEMISVSWASNYPYTLYLLAKGISYFEEKKETEESINNYYTNNFYGTANGVQIQQGTKDSKQSQKLSLLLDVTRIEELIQTIRKYDSVLNDEYGIEGAAKIRNATKELDAAIHKNEETDKMKEILEYIRDLSVNAGGGLVATGILHLISLIMG